MKKTNLFLSLFLVLVALGANAADVPVTGDITTNTSWTSNNIYVLFGDVKVKSGATLSIQEGTLIKGDKTTGGKLVITAGSKINAQGSATKPIVFTSNLPAGQRSRGDWGGIAILGNAPTNIKDISGNPLQGLLECGTAPDFNYGGSDAADNSGVLSYVRIEYAGFVCGTNTEFNSLALAGVGSGTKIDHVQVSFGQDDGFEWWGGNSNPTHLISIGSRDDDFDTDNGFTGKVQFGLIIRVDTIADQGDISNGFESDNDANGSFNAPYTSPVFSNITIIGPAQTLTSPIDAKYGWAFRLRRNTATNVFNSVVVGYKKGLRIEGSGSQAKASGDTLEFKYNIIEGSVEKAFESSFDSAYLANALTNNTIYGGQPNATVNMVAPYAAAPDFRLQSTSPALTGANFTNPKLATGFTPVAYKGAFGGTDNWTDCWAEFSPQDEDYSNDSINYGVTAQISNSGPLTFCTGGSVALTASSSVPGSSYLWSTGGSSPTINPTASGTYRVTVTSPRGCKTTASKVVVVNPNPPVPTITSSSTSFCTGDNGVTLTGSNASKYSWSNGDTTSSITVNSPGTYRLTVTNANQCSAQSAVIQITENIPVVPAISASGSTSFCVGDSVSINITNSNNFNSFAWSNNKVAQSITVTNSGVYSVITTDNNGCTASSNSITISVSNSPTPTISANGDINLCSGDTVTLTSSQSDTYLWSNNATTRSINVTTSGSYNVSVTNANVCNGIGTSNTITVTVTPQPVAGFTQNVNGASVNFISNSSNATSYNWTFGDGGSSNSQDPSHTYGANGTYTVTLTTTNGICSDVSTGSVTITTVGVKEIKNAIENIRLFPNPNYGVATLEIITSDFSDAVISVYDVAGRDVLKINSELINGTNAINISTNEFAAGVYFVNVRNESNNKIIRMIVSK